VELDKGHEMNQFHIQEVLLIVKGFIVSELSLNRNRHGDANRESWTKIATT